MRNKEIKILFQNMELDSGDEEMNITDNTDDEGIQEETEKTETTRKSEQNIMFTETTRKSEQNVMFTYVGR